MTRRSISTTRRVAIFASAGGVCHICEAKILPGDSWEVEHKVPLAMGGEDDGDNLAPAHVACHRQKTTADAGQIAKAKRISAKHIGAFRPRSIIPGSRASGVKKRMDGTVERRPK